MTEAAGCLSYSESVQAMVCTTFAIEVASLRETDAELPEKRLLFGGKFSDAAQTDLDHR